MKLGDIVFQKLIGFIVLFLYQSHHHLINLGLGFRRNGKAGISSKILIMQLFHGYHSHLRIHTVAGYHGSCRLGSSLNIIGSSCSAGMENEFLRTTSAGESGNLIFQFFLRIEIMVSLFLHLHGISQGSGCSGNNGDFMNRSGVLLQSSNQGMSNLMVCNNQLFLLCHHLIFLLVTGNNHLDGLFQVGLDNSFSAGTNRP